MARVHTRRPGSEAPAAARHKAAERKKPSYKVVIEEITEKTKLKTLLSFNPKPPQGYTFIPAGDPQLTRRCKKISREMSAIVHIVSMATAKNTGLSQEVKRVGYHFSSIAVERACNSLGVTLTELGRVAHSTLATLNEDLPKRAEKARTRNGRVSPCFDLSLDQATIDTQARQAIKDLFPKIPAAELHAIVSRSFQKGSDLVGTSSNLSLARRVHLAVVAHVRHTKTNYDRLLRIVPWSEARQLVESKTLDQIVQWRGNDDDAEVLQDVLREVIVLSDDEDGEEEPEGSQGPHQKSEQVQAPNMPRLPQYERRESIPVDQIQTQPMQLSMDDMEDSDSEGSVQIVHSVHRPSGNPDSLREGRLGAVRLQRWEDAIYRQRDHQQCLVASSNPSKIPPYTRDFAELPLRPAHSEGYNGTEQGLNLTSFDKQPRPGGPLIAANINSETQVQLPARQLERIHTQPTGLPQITHQYPDNLHAFQSYDMGAQTRPSPVKRPLSLSESERMSGRTDTFYGASYSASGPFGAETVLPSVENESYDSPALARPSDSMQSLPPLRSYPHDTPNAHMMTGALLPNHESVSTNAKRPYVLETQAAPRRQEGWSPLTTARHANEVSYCLRHNLQLESPSEHLHEGETRSYGENNPFVPRESLGRAENQKLAARPPVRYGLSQASQTKTIEAVHELRQVNPFDETIKGRPVYEKIGSRFVRVDPVVDARGLTRRVPTVQAQGNTSRDLYSHDVHNDYGQGRQAEYQDDYQHLDGQPSRTRSGPRLKYGQIPHPPVARPGEIPQSFAFQSSAEFNKGPDAHDLQRREAPAGLDTRTPEEAPPIVWLKRAGEKVQPGGELPQIYQSRDASRRGVQDHSAMPNSNRESEGSVKKYIVID